MDHFTMLNYSSKKPSSISTIKKTKKIAFSTLAIVVSLLSFTSQTIVAQTAGDYRSIINGGLSTTVNWEDASTWERYNSVTAGRIPATVAPDFNDGVITVRSPTYIKINSNATLNLMPDVTTTISRTGFINTLITSNNNGCVIAGDQTIVNLLNFNFGNVITTGSNRLILATTASIQNNSATDLYVIGKLQLNYAAGISTKTYRIDDGTGYTPVTLTLANTSGIGGIEISTTNTDQPNINTSNFIASKIVNRYWRLVNNGLFFTNIFTNLTWLADDVNSSTKKAQYKVGKFLGALWTYPATSNHSKNSITTTGFNTLGDLQLGEMECIINIPDANFKTALLANTAINTNADGEIQYAEAIAYSGAISVNNLGINSLTGIEAFTNITSLNCSNNNLTTLNIAENPNLVSIDCSANNINNLTFTPNTKITSLQIFGNQLSGTLNLSACTNLVNVNFGNNQITSLLLPATNTLVVINCDNNLLTAIDVTANPSLTNLTCTNNAITSLDLSQNPNLNNLFCNINQLTSLNIQNGNNTNLGAFSTKNNSSLTCIKVDNVAYLNTLELHLKSLKMSEALNDTLRILTSLTNIGIVYLNKSVTYQKALDYFLRSFQLSLAIKDDYSIGTSAVNLGELYFKMGDDKKALEYLLQSEKAYKGTENLPYTLNYIGRVFLRQKKFEKAIEIHTEAYNISKKLDTKLDQTQSLVALAQAYRASGNIASAIKIFKQAVEIAITLNAIVEMKDAYEGLSDSYSQEADYTNAYKYQNLLLAVKDSIYNFNTDKKLGTLQFGFDLEKKEGEIILLNKYREIQRREIQRQKIVKTGFIGEFIAVLLFASVFFRQRNKISKEKKRSEKLLLNILPAETAEELKATGTAKTKRLDLVSVLFTDFKNFTQASEILTPEELVAEINYCYSEFDRIVTRRGIEKIKTIGDSYMCAGGLPLSNNTHPFDVVGAGIEMVNFIEKNKQERIQSGLPYFELRLGIHTGPVVAGIVGINKFAYDIWGDTVNTASRMESSGEVGKVNISRTTYELVKKEFNCIYRGKIEAKNKGVMDMYFAKEIQENKAKPFTNLYTEIQLN